MKPTKEEMEIRVNASMANERPALNEEEAAIARGYGLIY
jgi:hypothetical protein